MGVMQIPLKLLTHDFYGRSTPKVARDLLGKLLVRTLGRRRIVGRIVETEAYPAKGDPACHAARGKSKSNAAMFGAIEASAKERTVDVAAMVHKAVARK